LRFFTSSGYRDPPTLLDKSNKTGCFSPLLPTARNRIAVIDGLTTPERVARPLKQPVSVPNRKVIINW
jgi:hypothetical protein